MGLLQNKLKRFQTHLDRSQKNSGRFRNHVDHMFACWPLPRFGRVLCVLDLSGRVFSICGPHVSFFVLSYRKMPPPSVENDVQRLRRRVQQPSRGPLEFETQFKTSQNLYFLRFRCFASFSLRRGHQNPSSGAQKVRRTFLGVPKRRLRK